MTSGVADRDCRTLGHAEQGKAADVEGRRHRFEILYPGLHGNALDIAAGQSATAGVVADECVVATQFRHPVTGEQVVRIPLDMGQPGGRLEQGRTFPDRRDGKTRAVFAGTKSDLLPFSAHRATIQSIQIIGPIGNNCGQGWLGHGTENTPALAKYLRVRLAKSIEDFAGLAHPAKQRRFRRRKTEGSPVPLNQWL